MSEAAKLIERVERGEFVDQHQEIMPVLRAAVRHETALAGIVKEYRAHDAAGIDVMYQLAADARAGK
jgi:hypothetical protein